MSYAEVSKSHDNHIHLYPFVSLKEHAWGQWAAQPKSDSLF